MRHWITELAGEAIAEPRHSACDACLDILCCVPDKTGVRTYRQEMRLPQIEGFWRTLWFYLTGA